MCARRGSGALAPMVRRGGVVVSLLIAGAVVSGCSATDGGGDETLTIFAAASLTETFTTLEEAFEHDHEGVDVVISFDSSTALAEQIRQGAPADVIATLGRTA